MSGKTKKKSKATPQLSMRIPKELREAIHDYAERNNTSVTRLTLGFYRSLLDAESQQEADQI